MRVRLRIFTGCGFVIAHLIHQPEPDRRVVVPYHSGSDLPRGGGYRATPDPDPVYLYTDDVIGILPERNLNNGQPSLHAALIAAAAPQPGEHVG